MGFWSWDKMHAPRPDHPAGGRSGGSDARRRIHGGTGRVRRTARHASQTHQLLHVRVVLPGRPRRRDRGGSLDALHGVAQADGPEGRRPLGERVEALDPADADEGQDRRLHDPERRRDPRDPRRAGCGYPVPVDDSWPHQLHPHRHQRLRRLLRRTLHTGGSDRGLSTAAGLPHPFGRRQRRSLETEPARQGEPDGASGLRATRTKGHRRSPRGLRRRQGFPERAPELSRRVRVAQRRRVRHRRHHVARRALGSPRRPTGLHRPRRPRQPRAPLPEGRRSSRGAHEDGPRPARG